MHYGVPNWDVYNQSNRTVQGYRKEINYAKFVLNHSNVLAYLCSADIGFKRLPELIKDIEEYRAAKAEFEDSLSEIDRLVYNLENRTMYCITKLDRNIAKTLLKILDVHRDQFITARDNIMAKYEINQNAECVISTKVLSAILIATVAVGFGVGVPMYLGII